VDSCAFRIILRKGSSDLLKMPVASSRTWNVRNCFIPAPRLPQERSGARVSAVMTLPEAYPRIFKNGANRFAEMAAYGSKINLDAELRLEASRARDLLAGRAYPS
jgi:hypothetical protein